MGDTVARSSHRRAMRVLEAEDGTPVVTEVLPRKPESVPEARRLVREVLASWELPHLMDAAELVVSELSANAVQHARASSFRVTVRRPGDRVRVAVIDKSTAEPVLRPSHDEAEGGRGLALVAAVAHQWGTDPLGWGKRVWADLAVPEPPDQQGQQWQVGEVTIWHTHRAQALYLLVLLAVMGVLVLGIVRFGQCHHHAVGTEGAAQ
ncbi:ATP-binding protein [Streptomyces sp. NPDC088560]|uniref:ATP-binding protein n=1 Tax=Streptomyces sp. NPDC088560 TaxID=3365868 RepID=UPI00381AC1DC